MFTCSFCNIKSYDSKLSLANHRRKCVSNPKRIEFVPKNGAIKAKERGEKFTHSTEARRKIALHNAMFPRTHTPEFRAKQRQRALERGLGGVRPSRWIQYQGKTLGSSYELEVCKSLDENNIRWDTCKKFHYIDPHGKARTYTPDIYLIDYDVYLDPKNDFLLNNINPKLGFTDKEKIDRVMQQNNIRVITLNKLQLSWESIKTMLL